MSTRCIELIITEDTLRGSGVVGDPYRRVTQVFTKDGELLADRDPSLGHELRRFADTLTEFECDSLLKIIKDVP